MDTWPSGPLACWPDTDLYIDSHFSWVKNLDKWTHAQMDAVIPMRTLLHYRGEGVCKNHSIMGLDTDGLVSQTNISMFKGIFTKACVFSKVCGLFVYLPVCLDQNVCWVKLLKGKIHYAELFIKTGGEFSLFTWLKIRRTAFMIVILPFWVHRSSTLLMVCILRNGEFDTDVLQNFGSVCQCVWRAKIPFKSSRDAGTKLIFWCADHKHLIWMIWNTDACKSPRDKQRYLCQRWERLSPLWMLTKQWTAAEINLWEPH